MSIILVTCLFALALAFILGLALGFFREFFAVPQDPLVGKIREALPGANCGACGYPGCDGYATAVASGAADAGKCSVGGPDTAKAIAALTGGNADVVAVVAMLACRGCFEKAPFKGDYTGLATCRGAKLSSGGIKLCAWGCVGFGDCVKVCQFGALSLGADGLPKIDTTKCTGCRLCVAECPQALLLPVPRDRKGPLTLCSNRNPQKAQVLKTCKAGCIKCELCVRACPQKCITMERGIPVVDYAQCTGCGACASKCPTKAMTLAG